MAAAAAAKKPFLCRANSPTTIWVSELASPPAICIVPADAADEGKLSLLWTVLRRKRAAIPHAASGCATFTAVGPRVPLPRGIDCIHGQVNITQRRFLTPVSRAG